jgi:hypothetical protein
MEPVVIALIVLGALLVAGAVCFALLMDEVATTDAHDSLLDRLNDF